MKNSLQNTVNYLTACGEQKSNSHNRHRILRSNATGFSQSPVDKSVVESFFIERERVNPAQQTLS